ncbi:Wzz/FepE/Etk N-terminal domain-containing protein [Mesorhizobium sp. RP14(2022)]|uniref:Wzz/FepE/Etk N-terminal domain-containing protein n=1 Tax=Mesorhizobium liriopis TaxID=2953882 RepID=A0ABT1C9B4_9HYPH|nr:Wzz/FepE/Etk N-terminal domain-containing protein [Mesorhizobium liriopis]MCO6050761.1 Wzz/FepE/Etk N-terminal domain-containing protein [Mesorhizobium liriopis]
MSRVQSNTADLDVDLRTLFGSLLRRWKRVLGVSVVVAAGTYGLASLATPQFRSETRLTIEGRESAFTRPNTATQAEPQPMDAEGITTQVELIGSSSILRKVADDLNLQTRDEFDEARNPSAVSKFLIETGLRTDPASMPVEERVLQKMRDKLSVFRVEGSRVIVVQFSSEDPEVARNVSSAIANAYLDVQRDTKLSSNTDATTWLEPEIAKLTGEVKEAEAKVAQYRAQSDLLIGQNNSVLATQQLSELSTELSRVRAARSSAEASAASVRTALQQGRSLDSIPEVLQSPLIQRLRERQVQLKTDIADLSTTLLENHPRVRSLRSQLGDLDGQIRAEAQNVLRSLANEADTAKLRENELVAQLNAQKDAAAKAGEQEVELRALEREANAKRDLLESYLGRFREASSRRDGNYLPADARVFSPATTPIEPYFPKKVPITVAAFVASLLLMSVLTLLSELFSGRAMRPARSAYSEPVDDVIAAAPPVATAEPVAPLALPAPRPQEATPVATTQVPEPKSGEIGIVRAAQRLVTGGTSRAVVISPEGDEAAAVSVLVAREVADTGLRVLLLDLSSSGAASRPMLDGVGFPGITNLLAAEAQFTDVIRAEHYSDCHVIPIGTADAAKAMRAADRLPIIMSSLTTAYDLVVVECGPIDAEGIERLVGEETSVLVSVLSSEDESVTKTVLDLKERGYEPLLVTPAGYRAPLPPKTDRDAA